MLIGRVRFWGFFGAALITGFAAFASPGDLFEYSREAAWDVRVVSESTRGAATVQDISFSDGNGSRITAYLVTPQRVQSHPGMLFVHWLDGKSPDSNRTEFLEEAIAYAGSGVESVLVNAMWSGEDWFRSRRQEDD